MLFPALIGGFFMHLGKPHKKVLFLVAGPLNGCATKEKGTFFNVRKKVPMATKPRGGGGERP